MEELQLRLLEKELMTKIFYFGAKRPFSPKSGGTMKNVKALNLYIGTNVLVYERSFCVKKTFSAKIVIFSLKMTQLNIFLCLTQAPNTAIQICRNK